MGSDDRLRTHCLRVSHKARLVRKMSAQTQHAVDDLIHEYDEAVEHFDMTMLEAYESEVERLEAER